MKTHQTNELLNHAAMRGNIKEVKRLLPLSDPTYNRSSALNAAATFGHTKCVELLIPVSQPEKSYALYWAAYYGHTDIVAMLIPVSDPHHKQSMALQSAAKNGHKECVDLLYPVSDPSAAIQALQTEYPDDPQKWQILEELEAERFNGVLHQEIGGAAPVKTQPPRKM